MLRLLAFAVIGFKLWMLVDAYKRRAETYWLWIILGVPGGALLYLFMVRLRDRDAALMGKRILRFLERPTSIEELEFRYGESASIANRLALAQGLADAGRYGEAKDHFAGVLDQRPEDVDALFGVGVCQLELGHAAAAVPPLTRVTELSPMYREFAVYPELESALVKSQQPEQARQLLEQLAKQHPLLPNVVLLAKHLIASGDSLGARERLQAALRYHQRAPKHVRRLHRRAASEAKALLEGTAARVEPAAPSS